MVYEKYKNKRKKKKKKTTTTILGRVNRKDASFLDGVNIKTIPKNEIYEIG